MRRSSRSLKPSKTITDVLCAETATNSLVFILPLVAQGSFYIHCNLFPLTDLWIFTGSTNGTCLTILSDVVEHGQGGIVEEDHFIMLPHPKTGHNCQYLFRENEQEIFEIVKFDESPRSWFIDNSVLQDGSLYFATRIDPLFMVLPFLKNTSTKFMTLDHILQDSNNEHITKLSHCITKEDLVLVTEMKGKDDLVVCKLNDDKVISWLEKKVYQTKDPLEQENICTSGAQSSTFVRSSKSRGTNTPDDYLRYAFGLVSDYISHYWSKKLKDYLGINDEILESSGEEPACKKVKLDESLVGQPDEDYSKFVIKNKKTDQNSNVKLTAAQKSLAKVNTKGMKSISSFFGAPKKSKK